MIFTGTPGGQPRPLIFEKCEISHKSFIFPPLNHIFSYSLSKKWFVLIPLGDSLTPNFWKMHDILKTIHNPALNHIFFYFLSIDYLHWQPLILSSTRIARGYAAWLLRLVFFIFFFHLVKRRGISLKLVSTPFLLYNKLCLNYCDAIPIFHIFPLFLQREILYFYWRPFSSLWW